MLQPTCTASLHSPYRAEGILALDACTALSGRVNVEVIEED